MTEGGEFPPIERPPDHPLVRSRVTATVARITLADADRRNALRIELSLDLERAVDEVLAAGASVVVLDAVAPVFCSGGDLDDLVTPRAPLHEIGRGAAALIDCPVPTLAVVDGPVIGAGINLVLACDVILCSERATFDPRLLDLGVHPGGGQLRSLARRVGRQGTVAMSLFGDVLTGPEAAAHGLAWRCVPNEELGAIADRWATRVASRPTEAVRRARSTLDATMELSHDEAVALELEAQQWSMEQPWIAERVTALRERLTRRDR